MGHPGNGSTIILNPWNLHKWEALNVAAIIFTPCTFNYINGKPFILCITYFKEAMQNLSMNSTPVDTNSSEAWQHGLTSKHPGTRERTEPEWVTLTLQRKSGWQSKGATNSVLLRNQFSSLPIPGVKGTQDHTGLLKRYWTSCSGWTVWTWRYLNKRWCQWLPSIKALSSRQHEILSLGNGSS